jgi:hypothetical protein
LSNRPMRWDPYVFSRGAGFEPFWRTHMAERSRNVLLIAGLGFDPRASDIARALMGYGGGGRRDLWLLCYDNAQQITPEQQQLVQANGAAFEGLFPHAGGIERLDIAMRTDRGRSATCANTKAAVSRPDALVAYDDVVIDISAMPRMIALMTVAQLLALFDARNSGSVPNLHVTASETVGQDPAAVEEELDEDVITLAGFSGRLDAESLRNPKIWLPILGEGQGLRLSRIFDKVQPDEICPVVPFPSRDPRRGDRIIEGHQRILFDEFRVEPRNILYASEYNPFEAYRQVFSAIDRYRDALVELEDCRVFVSPLSSKLLSIGALLACYDHKKQPSGRFHVGMPYVEAAAYGPSVGASTAEREFSSMWLTGEWERL